MNTIHRVRVTLILSISDIDLWNLGHRPNLKPSLSSTHNKQSLYKIWIPFSNNERRISVTSFMPHYLTLTFDTRVISVIWNLRCHLHHGNISVYCSDYELPLLKLKGWFALGPVKQVLSIFDLWLLGHTGDFCCNPCADPEGGSGPGPFPRPPWKITKLKGSLSKLIRIPWKLQSYQASIRWWADDGPFLAFLDHLSPHQLKN